MESPEPEPGREPEREPAREREQELERERELERELEQERELSAEERAELERLRTQSATGQGRAARTGRWVGACALLVIGALLGVLAVVAVYLRSEVLDTDTYVETVAPLAEDPDVREAVTNRLTDEIVTRTDIASLATDVANRLVAEGAPARVTDLVGPAVSALTSFLHNEIYKLLGTEEFRDVWEQVNRTAHEEVTTVLTGGQGRLLSTSGTTVTIDLGVLLSAVKERLVARGLTLLSRVPDVSIPYQLIDSDKLPQVRTYTKMLNSAGTWLPWVALAVLAAGILAAPNRRRAILVGFALLAAFAAITLGGISIARTYYLDHLPPAVRSPEAATAILDALLRYLIAALQTLLVAALVFVVAAWLAGPSRVTTWIRGLANRGLDATARSLSRAGSWVATIGRALAGARPAIYIGLVVLALVLLVLANRPGIAAVLWTTFAVLVLFAVVEIFVRARPSVTPAT